MEVTGCSWTERKDRRGLRTIADRTLRRSVDVIGLISRNVRLRGPKKSVIEGGPQVIAIGSVMAHVACSATSGPAAYKIPNIWRTISLVDICRLRFRLSGIGCQGCLDITPGTRLRFDLDGEGHRRHPVVESREGQVDEGLLVIHSLPMQRAARVHKPDLEMPRFAELGEHCPDDLEIDIANEVPGPEGAEVPNCRSIPIGTGG
jgi:hypothetical protein